MSTQAPVTAAAWGCAWEHVGMKKVWAVGYLLKLVFSEGFVAIYILL